MFSILSPLSFCNLFSRRLCSASPQACLVFPIYSLASPSLLHFGPALSRSCINRKIQIQISKRNQHVEQREALLYRQILVVHDQKADFREKGARGLKHVGLLASRRAHGTWARSWSRPRRLRPRPVLPAHAADRAAHVAWREPSQGLCRQLVA